MDATKFVDQSDAVILRAICQQEIPEKVLVDKDAWKRICQVRGRYLTDVDDDTWRAICQVRGEAGTPPGPYK